MILKEELGRSYSNKKINFAIVGFGNIARTHALGVFDANLRFNLPYQINIKYIVTRSKVESQVQGITYTDDITQVLKDPEIDFIDICTPNAAHTSLIKQAIAYKKGVYCEKPISSKLKETEEVTTLTKEKGVNNAVALIYRFMPAICLLKRALLCKSIGDIIEFKLRTYHSSYLDPNKKGAWRTLKEAGGGALLDLGIHLVDLVNYTLGEIGEMKNTPRIYFNDRTEVDEITKCDLRLKNGVRGSIEVSRVFSERKHTDEYIIYGTKGSIKLKFERPYEIEMYDYSINRSSIIGLTNDDIVLKYYSKPRNSLGFFQDCHTAALVSFCNLLYGMEMEYRHADFEASLLAERIINMK